MTRVTGARTINRVYRAAGLNFVECFRAMSCAARHETLCLCLARGRAGGVRRTVAHSVLSSGPSLGWALLLRWSSPMLAEIFILRLEMMARVAAREQPQPDQSGSESDLKRVTQAERLRLGLVFSVARAAVGLFA